jgi:hypothetical protein
MTFFTPIQVRVLKTSLVLAIFAWGLTLLKLPDYLDLIIKVVGMILMLSWEFLISRQWRNAAIMALVAGGSFSLQLLMDNYLPGTNTDSGALLSHVNLFTAYLLSVITRFHLMGIENKVSAGLLAAVIFYFLPKTGNPFSSGFLHYSFLTAPLFVWFKMVFYYVTVFLIENSYRSRTFFGKLLSKIQVFNKWDYFFMWLAVYFVFASCIGDLSTRVSLLFGREGMPAEPAWLSILFMIFAVFFLYAGALLLRNIITGRALTTGAYSPWMLLLHLLPGVNIIAVVICFTLPEKQENFMENAVTYISAKRDIARKVIIAAGIMITAYNIYNMLIVPTGLRLFAISILAGLYLLKIFAYIKLPSNKSFVYLVVGLNIITVAYSINDYFILYLSLIYLSYYFLQELFYPELEIDDMVQLSENESKV